MKGREFIEAAAAILAVSAAAWGVGNPVSAGTVPPSSLGGGLIRRPQMVGAGGNLSGGTIGAGGTLRGVTPYGTGSYLWNAPPSSGPGNFRIQNPSQYFSPYGVVYPPYYSPFGIGGTSIPGSTGAGWLPNTSVAGQATQGFAISSAGGNNVVANPHVGVSNTRFRAMRYSTLELESLILDGAGSYAQARRIVNEYDIGQMERLRQNLDRLKHRASPLRQSLIVRDESLRPLSALRPPRNIPQPFELPAVKIRTRRPQADLLQQSRAQDDESQKVLEQPRSAQIRQGDASEEKTDTERFIIGGSEKEPASEGSKEGPASLWQISSADRVKGSPDEASVASYSEEQFEQYLREGDGYLKQGIFYWAADAYTLAALYKPSDYRSYAGKSRAFFAAGEYITSAKSLAQALVIRPEYARVKVDFEALIGDKDKLDTRVVDLEKWVEKSGAVELRFLLGYVYFQTGRLDEAKEAIAAVEEKMPDMPAVKALKQALKSGAE